jgi:hypothetical protein
MTSSSGWIGVDLDGTLASYGKWEGPTHIGPPIRLMVERVRGWLARGIEVRIFTARVSDRDPQTIPAIRAWCLEHVGAVLPVTNVKDYAMLELWDDRAIQVITNTGHRADGRTTTRAIEVFDSAGISQGIIHI